MLDAQGQLCTADGYRVQNATGGAIVARGGKIGITREGRVLVDGQPVGQIRVVEFADPHGLTREGYSYYNASESAAASVKPAANTVVEHEAVEMSNVSLPYEMVKMMVGVRAYAANQKVITTLDETTSKLIEQVGMPL
jgi:flagellar basal-body rod protein FlgG